VGFFFPTSVPGSTSCLLLQLRPQHCSLWPHLVPTDEDLTTHGDSPIAIQGPITTARARQIQYQVKSFLSSTPCQLQDRLLPNEILIVRNEGQAYEGLKNQLGGAQGCGQGAGQETG
jgi:hypothetical protein